MAPLWFFFTTVFPDILMTTSNILKVIFNNIRVKALKKMTTVDISRLQLLEERASQAESLISLLKNEVIQIIFMLYHFLEYCFSGVTYTFNLIFINKVHT